MTQPSIAETIAFIQVVHDYPDKSGAPYWQHPLAVMELLPDDAPLEQKLIALLHDVLEDTDITPDDLYARGYSERVVAACKLLDFKHECDPDLPYPTKVRQLIESGNEDAIRVKYADMTHNSSHKRIECLPQEDQQYHQQKYVFPKQMLRQAIQRIERDNGYACQLDAAIGF